MTENQKTMAVALARVRFRHGSPVRQFAWDMCARTVHPEAGPLTPRQHKYLCDSVVRFRQQLDGRILRIAEAELALIAGAQGVAC